jgi:hypothetical protein
MLDHTAVRGLAARAAAIARLRIFIPAGLLGGDWHAYKGRPAPPPKSPAPPKKQAPAPSPGAPKPEEPKPSSPPKEGH